jgi:hypothetical protein
VEQEADEQLRAVVVVDEAEQEGSAVEVRGGEEAAVGGGERVL